MKDSIRLSMPLAKENILVARLVASGIAALKKLDVERAEDVKVAANEALAILLKEGFEEATVTFSGGEELVIEVTGSGGNPAPLPGGDIGALLLTELVDRAETTEENGVIRSVLLCIRSVQ